MSILEGKHSSMHSTCTRAMNNSLQIWIRSVKLIFTESHMRIMYVLKESLAALKTL